MDRLAARLQCLRHGIVESMSQRDTAHPVIHRRMDPIGEQDDHQLLIRVDPDRGAGEAGVAEGARREPRAVGVRAGVAGRMLQEYVDAWRKRLLAFAADRLPRLERHRRVNEMIERFELAETATRRPHETSGSDRARCLLARTLVGAPRVLLLDEPSQELDARSRVQWNRILHSVRDDFQIPILFASHDLAQCIELADQMLLLREGRIAQRGRPREILDRPAGVEVARLLGISNLFQAEITALDPGRNTSRLRFLEQELNGTYFPGHLLGDRVWVCVRAEELRASERNGVKPEANQVPAKLLRVAELPQSVRLEFTSEISVELPLGEFERQKDNKDWLVEFPPEALRVL